MRVVVYGIAVLLLALPCLAHDHPAHLGTDGATLGSHKGMPAPGMEVLAGFAYAEPAGAELKGLPDGVVAKPLVPLPARVSALDGKEVWVRGFMLPAEMDAHGVRSFLLVGGMPGCCFSSEPKMNQWITVNMGDGPYPDFTPDDPVWVRGVLSVREEIRHGELRSLYRMRGLEVDDSAAGE